MWCRFSAWTAFVYVGPCINTAAGRSGKHSIINLSVQPLKQKCVFCRRKDSNTMILSRVEKRIWVWSRDLVRKFKVYESDAAGSPFQLMGPAVTSLLFFLQEFPLRCQPLSMHVTVWVHHSLLLVMHLLHRVGFLSLMLPLPFPNLLTEIINAVQVWVVDQREEVSVPKLLIGSFPR